VIPDRRESGVAGFAALAISCAYATIAWAHGAIGVARNDDWSYYHVTFRLANHGVFRLDGWVETLFVGQAFLAWPVVKVFGPTIAPLQIAVAVLAAAALWAAYLVIRSFLSRGWSALAVGCLAVGPIYGTLSVSFMTDVPAFALQVLALLAGMRALRRGTSSLRWFVVALGFGLAAFSIREYAVAAGLAVCVVVLTDARSVDRRRALRLGGVVIAWVAALLAVFTWRRGMANTVNPGLDLSMAGIGSSVGTAYQAALTLAVFVAPVALVVSPTQLWSTAWTRARRTTVVVLGALAVAVVGVAAVPRQPFLGNYFGRYGSYASSLPGLHPAILDGWMWQILRAAGFATALVIGLLAAVRRVEKRRPPVAADEPSVAANGRVLVATYVGIAILLALVAILTTTAPYYDRYLIGLVPFVAALAIDAGHSRRLVARRAGVSAAVALGVLCLIGLTFVDAAATVDGAKWQLARTMQHRGFQPAVIDGGQEWFGYHQRDDIHMRPRVPGRGYWVTLFTARPTCVRLTLEPPGRAGIAGAAVPPRELESLRVRSLMGVSYRLNAIAGPQRCERHRAPPRGAGSARAGPAEASSARSKSALGPIPRG
jgi:hypothetical protein